MLSMVVAMAEDRIIGNAGDIPWYLPNDFKHFKEITMGHPIIMGRKTWDSLPEKVRPLAGRNNIIVSRSGNVEIPEGCTVSTDWHNAQAKNIDDKKIMVRNGWKK